MPFFCGVDIIEIERIRHSLETIGQRFRDKVFTEREITYCESKKGSKYQSYAARFAAKEAVGKALGLGVGGELSFTDIEVINDSGGKPHVFLSSSALDLLKEKYNMENINISLSLSHCRAYAVASVVMEYTESTGGVLTERG